MGNSIYWIRGPANPKNISVLYMHREILKEKEETL